LLLVLLLAAERDDDVARRLELLVDELGAGTAGTMGASGRRRM
jgi:hypothetical protein